MRITLTALACSTLPFFMQGCGGGDSPVAGHAVTASPQLTLAQMCNSQTMQQAMPAGVTVKDIPNLKTYLPAVFRATKDGVNLLVENALGDGAPAYCLVTGSYVTNPETGKTANFAATFPAADKWNGKYLQLGCGGNCGNVGDGGAPAPTHIRAGYAVWQTDDGHIDGSIAATGNSLEADSSWAVASPGVPNTDAIQDYLHRAVHMLAVLGQQATAATYNVSKVTQSYFLGCSDGGREAMVEATKYPQDFDGIVAGAPYNMRKGNLNFLTRTLTQLRSTSAQLSAPQLKLVANTMIASCDAADGLSDGLVQNPNACNFNPRRDVPVCAPGQAGSDTCLSSDQIDSVTAIISAARDQAGSVVAAGWSPNVLGEDSGIPSVVFPSQPVGGPDPFGPEPYLTMFNDWSIGNYTIRNMAYYGAPNYDGRSSLGQTFTLSDPSDPATFHIAFPAQTLATISSGLQNGLWDDPKALSAFIQKGGKLFMYHGLADPYLNANNTIQYYQSLATSQGGYSALKDSVRLFLAPGMAHCGWGDGPNAFVSQYHSGDGESPAIPFDAQHDALASLDKWVTTKVAPKSITATKYKDDTPSSGVVRTMPLCPFPAQARYSGTGSLNDAANWSCSESDTGLLNFGTAGAIAGML